MLSEKSGDLPSINLFLGKLSGVKVSEVIMKSTYARVIIACGLLLSVQKTIAQTIADSLWMDEIRVQATRVDVQDSYQAVAVQRIDSLQIQRISTTNLSGLLQALTPINVRDAGPGGLATFSLRGFSASQTQVIWNGFPLNHPMLGVTDLSLIPTIAIQSVAVSAGASNASFGEKGGGTVAIKTAQPTKGVGVQYSTGSYGTNAYSVQAGQQIKDWNVQVLAGFRNADNDFEYLTRAFSNEAGGFVDVEKKREHNRTESATVIIGLERESDHDVFSTKLWMLDSINQIPGGISSQGNSAQQDDRFVRWVSTWKRQFEKHRLRISSYVSTQDLDYVDDAAQINSLSTTDLFSLDASLSSSFHPKLQTIGAIQLSRAVVRSSEYPADVARNQFSLNLQSVWMPVKHLFIYPGVRLDSYSDFGNAYTAQLGANYSLIKDQLFLKSTVSRNFTTPTFNDLYWPALGDPNLQPETMIKAESSIEFRLNRQQVTSSTELTVYTADVSNGIRWLPQSNGQSAPQNIESLAIRGVELTVSSQIDLNPVDILLGGSLNQALASINQARFENDRAADKQLIYTPEWQYKGHATIQVKSFSAMVLYAYIDERFTTSDHSSPFDPLPAYNTLDVTGSLSVETSLGKHQILLGIRNLLDERYSVIRDYPMPGTHFNLTFTTNFKTN
jgi:iron complex outermembrane receptor protein